MIVENATRHFTCDSAYALVGSPVTVCQTNHLWSHDTPFCAAVCLDELAAPSNGAVSPGSKIEGVRRHFPCNAGFEIV